MLQNKKTIQILYGLPASGKTTYAEDKAKESKPTRHSSSNMEIISLDPLLKKAKNNDEFKDLFAKEISKCKKNVSLIIIDGLITTNEEVKSAIEIIKSNISEADNWCFEIIYWKEDREACLWNDRGRREKGSANTIKNKSFEIPDPKKIGIDKTAITRKNIVKKPEYLIFYNNIKSKLSLTEDNHKQYWLGNKSQTVGFVSYTWSLGGTSGNCWNDNISRVDPDTNIPSFDEFDSVLELIYPECSFLKYKKIYNKCVSIRDYSDGDYYGGSVTYAYYFCDVQKLYETLIEMDIINSPEISLQKET